MHSDAQRDGHDVDRFILEEIESVPHLEALLWLWRTAPKAASAEQIVKDLYISLPQAYGLLDNLHRRGLITRRPGGLYFYDTVSEDRNRMIEAVDATYRRELIRISGIIHSKASRGVRAFADAFRFRKDRG